MYYIELKNVSKTHGKWAIVFDTTFETKNTPEKVGWKPSSRASYKRSFWTLLLFQQQTHASRSTSGASYDVHHFPTAPPGPNGASISSWSSIHSGSRKKLATSRTEEAHKERSSVSSISFSIYMERSKKAIYSGRVRICSLRPTL